MKKKRKIEIKTKKNFSNIIEAYQFFKEHSTEYDANRNEIILKLKEDNCLKPGISILDFGGGDGQLLFDLYTGMSLNQFFPKLYLYEPVEYYQEIAKLKFASVGCRALTILNEIDAVCESSIDLILANHVLYYVENLDQTISQLMSKLNEGGQVLILMADDKNTLIQLWEIFFEKLGMKVPYFVARNLRLLLQNQSVKYSEIDRINSSFSFKNTQKNRHNMLQFLLGIDSDQFDDETINKIISRYENDNYINIPLLDSLFVIKK